MTDEAILRRGSGGAGRRREGRREMFDGCEQQSAHIGNKLNVILITMELIPTTMNMMKVKG